jgi:glycerol-1-phosphate dehydrogenase [NAD(P)+]
MHAMEFPRDVFLGNDILHIIRNILEKHHFRNPLVASGKKTYEIAGEKIASILSSECIISETMGADEAQRIALEAKQRKCDIIIASGGGRIMDMAKLASSLESIPWISVTTTPSNDSLSSQSISYLLMRECEEKGIKENPIHPPLSIIADMDILQKSPRRMVCAGYGDLISNYTAIKDWELAHRLKGEYISEYSSALSLMSAKVAMENTPLFLSDFTEATRIVVSGLIASGVAMSIAGSSRPASGSEHLFSHALDALGSKAFHGEQCGVGTIMMMYLYNEDWMGVKNALSSIGSPTTAEGLGVTDEIVVRALTMAHTIRDRYTILGDKGLTEKAARSLAEKTGVI